MKSQKNQPPRAELRVEAVEGDRWTWCYVEPDDGVKLYSNETYATADDAKDWSRRAYPDVPLAEDQQG
ncbi:MAG: hypothetical protein M3163_02530 [Actinomycetota bacterium]|nr:hypothetical protein [Actinomycetota bacterium]